MATARKSFESILLDRSWVSQQDLERARQRKKPGQEIWLTCWSRWARWSRNGWPARSPRNIACPFRLISTSNALDNELVLKVPINYAKKNRLLPLAIDSDTVTVAVADPANYEPLDDLHVLFGKTIKRWWRRPRLSPRRSTALTIRRRPPRRTI